MKKVREGKRMKGFKICLIAIVLVCAYSIAKAADLLPDLVVESADFVPRPKEMGLIDLVKICVANQGKVDAGKCTLSLSCTAIKCADGQQCDEISRLIQGDIPVPALKSGERTCVEWKSPSVITWITGKYSLTTQIDKYNAVQESNETNNINQSTIYIKSFSPKPL